MNKTGVFLLIAALFFPASVLLVPTPAEALRVIESAEDLPDEIRQQFIEQRTRREQLAQDPSRMTLKERVERLENLLELDAASSSQWEPIND